MQAPYIMLPPSVRLAEEVCDTVDEVEGRQDKLSDSQLERIGDRVRSAVHEGEHAVKGIKNESAANCQAITDIVNFSIAGLGTSQVVAEQVLQGAMDTVNRSSSNEYRIDIEKCVTE